MADEADGYADAGDASACGGGQLVGGVLYRAGGLWGWGWGGRTTDGDVEGLFGGVGVWWWHFGEGRSEEGGQGG